MEHIGIDLGATRSQVCVVVEGKVIEEKEVSTQRLAGWLKKRKGTSRVVMEACTEARAVVALVEEAGHEAVVIHAGLARTVGVGARRQKNDVRDARALALYSDRVAEPEGVHLKGEVSRTWLRICATRALLVKMRTSLINQVKSGLREELLPTGPRFSQRSSASIRETLLAHPSGLDRATSVLLDTLDSLDERIAELEAELLRVAAEDARVQLAQTMPGVGLLTATLFVATLDEIERFERAEQVANDLGLTPSESTTGFKTCRGGITKPGPSGCEASSCAEICLPSPLRWGPLHSRFIYTP